MWEKIVLLDKSLQTEIIVNEINCSDALFIMVKVFMYCRSTPNFLRIINSYKI